ncbi:hypothetical protein [Parasitella parasitica]|uniref:F-box domain-containing protein n=1 Tax=Parasitella parasitica TaxID=35722 RepID=A0A0B7NHA1_9FUNG|nr:hypothetical protein [Parasitella parasitica]
MNRLPFEVLLQVFEYIPFAEFGLLYDVFAQTLVDEAVVYKLGKNRTLPIVSLISTNLHELATDKVNRRNESSLSMYYASYDPSHRYIWTLPDFSCSQHYFKVKDAYVSHGKLVLRRPHDNTLFSQKSLVSLWDIRKRFPPTRAGSFSGASEYSRIKSQELTLHQPGCVLDSCLVPSSTNSSVKKISLGDNTSENTRIGVVGKEVKKDEALLKRPALPSNYTRQVPKAGADGSICSKSSLLVPTYPDPTCGYFLVERLAIDIPTFLKLYC